MSLQGALSMDDTCVVGADARPELVSAGDMSFVSLSEWQRGGRIRFETKAVSIKVFRENTYGLLCFRSGDLELLYMDAVARMTMRHTYVGYAVLFMAGVLGFIYTCFEQWYIPRGSFPAFMQNLSKGDWTSLQVSSSRSTHYIFRPFTDTLHGTHPRSSRPCLRSTSPREFWRAWRLLQLLDRLATISFTKQTSSRTRCGHSACSGASTWP